MEHLIKYINEDYKTLGHSRELGYLFDKRERGRRLLAQAIVEQANKIQLLEAVVIDLYKQVHPAKFNEGDTVSGYLIKTVEFSSNQLGWGYRVLGGNGEYGYKNEESLCDLKLLKGNIG